MDRSQKLTQPPLACQMELSADGVGEAFYTELGEASPDMARLFARPKSLQASLLESTAGECHAMRTCRASAAPGAAEGAGLGFPLRKGATSVRLCSATSTERAPPLSQAALFMRRLDTLVSMADDPAALFNDTRALSVRHVKVPPRPVYPSSLPSDEGDAVLSRRWHTRAEPHFARAASAALKPGSRAEREARSEPAAGCAVRGAAGGLRGLRWRFRRHRSSSPQRTGRMVHHPHLPPA